MDCSTLNLESLPSELRRLVFAYLDPPAVRALRLTCRLLASDGLDALLPPHLTALAWRLSRDLQRLEAISQHPQLRGRPRTLTLNLAELDGYNARFATFFQYFAVEPEERTRILSSTWEEEEHPDVGQRGQQAEVDEVTLNGILGRLENLSEVRVLFEECPYRNDALRRAFELRSCRAFEPARAARAIGKVLRGMASSTSVDRFECDHVPMVEELGTALAERSRGDGGLTSLALTFGAEEELFQPRKPLRRSMADTMRFGALAELKLARIVVEEDVLVSLLGQVAATLCRLRLGGYGVTSDVGDFDEGIWLVGGDGGASAVAPSFASLFTRLRDLGFARLERLHLAGDFVTERFEEYRFYPLLDDRWAPVAEGLGHDLRPRRPEELDGRAVEEFVLREGPLPSFLRLRELAELGAG